MGLILRLCTIHFPDWQIFDEIYYYNFSRDYLAGNYFFDVHPPLGKLFISLGEAIFSNSIFGARFFQSLAGVAILYFGYELSLKFFKNKTIAIFSIILLFLETSLFIESRYALINIFIIFFTLPSFICFWQWREKKEIKYFYYSLFFVSLATSVKWTGIFTLAVYFIFLILDYQSRTEFIDYFSNSPLKSIFYCILVLILPYLAIYLADVVKGDKFFTWHEQAYNFHKNLVGNHPYASRWYRWFMDARPIWLEFRQTPQGTVIGVLEVGNIVILWTGIVAFFVNIYYYFVKKDKALLLIMLAILFNTIPWIIIKREAFYYHFIPILPFYLVSIAYFLGQLYKNKWLKFVVILILFFALYFFICFWPLLVGQNISYEQYNNAVIFDSWR